jgi:hypothetical protein
MRDYPNLKTQINLKEHERLSNFKLTQIKVKEHE